MYPDVTDLTAAIIAFRDDREWAQFHTPRNLAEALSVEAGELLELFLFGRDPAVELIGAELADIMIYALTMAHDLGIDIEDAITRKLKVNAGRYSVEMFRGSNAKAG